MRQRDRRQTPDTKTPCLSPKHPLPATYPMPHRRSPGRAARWEMPMVTHLGIRVIIYQGGSSGRHPKGARSIGIGHPLRGDRCADTHFDPLDPMGSPSRNPPFRRPCEGVALVREPGNQCDTLTGSRTACGARSTGLRGYAPRPVAKERAPARGASFPTLLNELMDFCATYMRHSCVARRGMPPR